MAGITPAGAAGSVGSAGLTVVVVNTIAKRYGIALDADEALAYGALLVPFFHFFGTAMAIVSQAIIDRLGRWASPPATEVVPGLTTAPK